MKERAIFLFVLLAATFIVFISAHSQDDMEFVDNSSFENPQRVPSVFRHDEHNESAGIEECNECHHVYDETGQKLEDESSEDQLCSGCHQEAASGRKPGLMKAFHTNCKGCHLKENKGPIMCGECHLRNPVTDG